jgi:hypothetical protein
VLNILDALQKEELVCGMALSHVPVEDFAVLLNNE